MPGVQLRYIFSEIGREYDREILQSARRLVKVSLSISKLFGHLNFNHNWLRENLLPKSLKFLPLIRTSRGYKYKLARKHVFDLIKLRITESNIAIKKKKIEVDQITKKVRAVLLKEHWDVLSQSNNQIQDGVKSNEKSNYLAKLGKLREPMLAKTNNSASQKSLWVKNLSKTKQISSSQQIVLETGQRFRSHTKMDPSLRHRCFS